MALLVGVKSETAVFGRDGDPEQADRARGGADLRRHVVLFIDLSFVGHDVLADEVARRSQDLLKFLLLHPRS